MSQDYNNPTFKKLLDKLQEDSWQLELLISGFAIFGLFSAYPPLEIAYETAKNEDYSQLAMILVMALSACSILIFNLLLHVLLRGLWIGALGLRYVSGDIDYEILNYSEKFNKYLKKNVGSFDRYIGRLENYCSVIFAVSFLLIFYVIAFISITSLFILILTYFLSETSFNSILPWIGIPLLIFFLIGTLFTFLDFISLGFLKKKKWLSRIYFPFYWCFSFITLSFLYRPLIYNFLDNTFGKRLSIFLLPIYISLVIITTLEYNRSNYINFDEPSGRSVANSENYEDQLIEASDFIDDIAINSKVITDSYIKVFIAFNKDIEEDIYKYNTNLKPDDDKRGIKIALGDRNIGAKVTNKLKDEFLAALNSIYTLDIDSTVQESDFVVAKTTKNQKGFETFIGIKNLKEGKHVLRVQQKTIVDSDTLFTNSVQIPFWYYPN